MLFKRRASLEVQLKESNERFKIENLRISFSIAKTFTPTANICDVRIYNLSQYTRGKFHELGDQITLNTGYESNEGEQVLFVANTQRVYHQYNLPEIITSLEGVDADLTTLLRQVQGSFSEGVSALTVLRHVADQMGIATISLPNNVQDQIFNQGRTYDGPAESVLIAISNYLNLDWSVQNKTLLFTNRGQSVDEPPIELSAETGMIYFPEILRDLTIRNDFLTQRRRIGWRVRSILNPKIKPRSRVQIYSSRTPELNGIYIVQSVRHIGDTHGNQWETVAEMVQA